MRYPKEVSTDLSAFFTDKSVSASFDLSKNQFDIAPRIPSKSYFENNIFKFSSKNTYLNFLKVQTFQRKYSINSPNNLFRDFFWRIKLLFPLRYRPRILSKNSPEIRPNIFQGFFFYFKQHLQNKFLESNFSKDLLKGFAINS